MIMDNGLYDKLKLIALIVLPIGTFISSFFDIWGIGYAEQIQATFKALDVLVGALVVISAKVYNKKLEEKTE